MSAKQEMPTVGGGSGGERCETCRFWSARASFGYCRRVAATFFSVRKDEYYESGDPTLWAGQPPVNSDDWCGEWKAKPEA